MNQTTFGGMGSQGYTPGAGAAIGSRRPGTSSTDYGYGVTHPMAPGVGGEKNTPKVMAHTNAYNSIEDSGMSTTELLLERFRKRLGARGARGFIGIQRSFKVMDDDESGSLNWAEFKKVNFELAYRGNRQ